MAWLERFVRPTVLEVVGVRGIAAVLECLGLDQVVQGAATVNNVVQVDQERIF